MLLRRFSSSSSSIFDSSVKALQRTAAARSPGGGRAYDYIRKAVASRLVDRLADIKRSFPVALDFGADAGALGEALANSRLAAQGEGDENVAGGGTGGSIVAGGVHTLHAVDGCAERLHRDSDAWPAREKAGIVTVPSVCDVIGGGARLPYADASMDIVFSNCALHWADDLPAVFAEARRVLRPDGVFLGALLGGETLAELRSAFVAAQSEREGGVSPHVSPMAGVADVGNVLAAAGFGMPTIDAETLRVGYPDALSLCEHLQFMGESGAAMARRPAGRRDTMLAMAAAYHTMYPAPSEEEEAAAAAAEVGEDNGFGSKAAAGGSGVVATFDVIYWIGWAPAAGQPKPLRRGSVPKGLGARGSGPPPLPASS